jgi:predicted dehydrogenase
MNTTRRQFLATATATAALGAKSPTANRTLKLGVIGVGWYGMVDAKAALKVGGVDVVAICDVDSEHLAKSAAELERLQGHRPKTFKLYEDLLQLKGLDAVIIATPPQWHALQFIAALDRGLDVYCEKPISYDVREGRAMVAAAERSQRVVQVGFQRRQSKALADARRLIDVGKIGRIVGVDAQIHYRAGTKDPTPQDPPASLDWNLWCGPGPKIPYSPQVGHLNWRLEKTSGHGHLVDWGIHLVDQVRVALGESMPRRIVAAGGLYELKGKITTPDTLTVSFEFARCPLVWRHRIWGAEEFTPETNNGIFFYGTEGTLFLTDTRLVVIPRGKNKERQDIKLECDLGTAHMADFLAAVHTRGKPICSMADAACSTATVQLAMIAYETGTPVVWNEQTQQIVGNAAAARLLKREYRAPWKHPG